MSSATVFALLEKRPLLITIAGPNGGGKSTFYSSHLAGTGLPFVNADIIAREMRIDSYAAANIASGLRKRYVEDKVNFVFETVFSDPAGDKLNFLTNAAEAGYTVILVFIGISNATVSEERVGMRILQGGHDVPLDKIRSRYPRTMANLAGAIRTVQNVFVYDNSNIGDPYQQLAIFTNGKLSWRREKLPRWFAGLVSS
ncbi:MAG TPA: zeta toxin family protein [Verrucomicrobiae bacterium]|nr:zeta toxin family protein [Verrucomicrobiae bacterium]